MDDLGINQTRCGAPYPGKQSFQPDQVDYCAGMMAAQQTAFGALAIGTLGDPFSTREIQEDYVNQYLRALTAHEVGHVLGCGITSWAVRYCPLRN